MLHKGVNALKRKALTVCVILLLLACVTVTGCFERGSTKYEATDELVEFVKDKGTFPKMQAADAAVIGEIYGIDLSRIEEYTLMSSSDTLLADEIGVFRLEDPDYASTLSRILEARLASAARAAEHYSPEQYAVIIKTAVKSRGLYVYYIVNKDSEKLTEQLTARIPLS